MISDVNILRLQQTRRGSNRVDMKAPTGSGMFNVNAQFEGGSVGRS